MAVIKRQLDGWVQGPGRFRVYKIRRSRDERQKLEAEYMRQRAMLYASLCQDGIHNFHQKGRCPYTQCAVFKRSSHSQASCSRWKDKPTSATAVIERFQPKTTWQSNKQTSKWEPIVPQILPIYRSPGMPLQFSETEAMKLEFPYPTPIVTFPNLRSCMLQLLERLADGTVPDIKFMGYHELIKALGERQNVIESLIQRALTQVEPEILELQGQRLTPQLLHEAQHNQRGRCLTWPTSGGYVDFVLDDRMPEYIRFYCGQSSRLAMRIAVQHSSQIRNGAIDRLHYFVLARGLGYRQAHFLRLWTTPERDESNNLLSLSVYKAQCHLIQNILETTFCRAFESLPGCILESLFGEADYSNVGLNCLPPLFDGYEVPATIRHKYLRHLQSSPDPDISIFFAVRQEQKQITGNRKRMLPTLLRTDYIEAFNQLVERNELNIQFRQPLNNSLESQWDIDTELRRIEASAGYYPTLEAKPLLRPKGDQTRAKVGVILSSDAIGIKSSEENASTYKIQGIDGLGLTEANSIIWTDCFQEIGSGTSKFTPESAQASQINNLQYSYIMQSGLQIIVLCGVQVQRQITSIFRNNGVSERFGPHQLSLRDESHSIWFLETERNISKVFISCPEPLMIAFLRDTDKRRQIRDVFGLVSALSGEKIKFYCWENACFISALLRQIYNQRNGIVPELSPTSLDPVFWDWLYYRGFTKVEHIQKLAQIAGTLELGMLWLTSYLRVMSMGQNIEAPYKGRHSGDAYHKACDLFKTLYNKRIEGVKAFHQKQRPDTNVEAELQEEAVHIIEDSIILNKDSYSCDEEVQNDPFVDLVGDLEGVDSDDGLESLLANENDDYTEDVGSKKEVSTQTKMQGLPTKKIPRLDSAYFRAIVNALNTNAGFKTTATRRAGHLNWRLHTFYSLISWVAVVSDEEYNGEKPVFAIRAQLSEPGTSHEHCIFPAFDGCLSTDPCIRLALQYILLNPKDNSKTWSNWKWAAVTELRYRYNSDKSERVAKANTLVDLLEGKYVRDLHGVPRRSTKRWEY